MKCPACDSFLSEDKFSTVNIEKCGSCGGIWARGDQLKDYIDKLFQHEKIKDLDSNYEDNVAEIKITEAVRKCPVCGRDMMKMNYMYDSNIILDRCNDCGGIWVDGDEIKKIAEYLKGREFERRLTQPLAKEMREDGEIYKLADAASGLKEEAFHTPSYALNKGFIDFIFGIFKR